MSRSKNFFHAVWSGYMLTILMSVMNLVTIPIAMSALGKADFGLWNAVAQVAAFTMILDLGLGPSLSRFLIDFKDERTDPSYANFLKSVFFVSLIQSVVFCVLMIAFIQHLPGLMGIAPEKKNLFIKLLLWQLVPSALGFPFRPFSLLLYSHQQIARLNGCSLAAVIVNTGMLILCLKADFGIYAYIVASWTSFLTMQIGVLFHVFRLKLLPSLKEARISLKTLKPLAAFSSNVFLIALGGKLVEFAPALLVTRHLGLLALADWTVGTRLITFAAQLVNRIPNSAEPAFWEMFKRDELALLRQRWIGLILLTGSSAALLGAGVVAINPSFIQVWTSSQVSWTTRPDLFLAVWIILLACASCLNMTPGITKRLGAMKFVYLFEGAVLLSIAYFPAIRFQSHGQIVVALILCVSLVRLPYGVYRICRDLEISSALLVKTLGRVSTVAALLLGLALTVRYATAALNHVSQFTINFSTYSVAAPAIVYFFGLPTELRKQLFENLTQFVRQRFHSSKTSA